MKLNKKMLLLIALAGMVLPGTNISYSSAKEGKYLIVPNPIPVQSQQENYSISTNMKWKTSGIFSYEITNEEKKEVTLRRMNTINQIVEIPEKIDNYTVVGVGEMCEEKCIVSENEVLLYPNQVQKLIVPPTVKIIGSYAFAGCSSLEAIEFNHSEKLTIYQNAFANCERLQKLDLNHMKIGPDAFAGLHPIKSVYLNDVSFYSIDLCETSTGIRPFGTRTVKNLYLSSAMKSFNIPKETSIQHLYVNGRKTTLSGNKQACKKIKTLHTVASAKAISFARKRKINYETLKICGKVSNIKKKKTSSGTQYTWKKVTTKAIGYQYKGKKWRKKTHTIPTYYRVSTENKNWFTNRSKVLDLTSKLSLKITPWNQWNERS
ncbi:MAG: leucine-rich repeat protein [Eubacterium sp.]|nr:leucine-rich repeat protein [Eubacterium sp.]